MMESMETLAVNSDYKYLKIRELAVEDRPREKLISQGPSMVTTAELLGILIGSGIQNMTSVDLARHLLKGQEGRLKTLAKCSVQELVKYRGIGLAKATIIVSAMELGRRLQEKKKECKPKISDPLSAYHLVRPCFSGKITEECWVMLIDRRSKLIKNHQVSKGGLAKTAIDPKVVFKAALEYHAHGIIMAHNHPSGNPNPSSSDLEITQNLLKAGKYLDIKILDHLILTDDSYFSFLDNHLL